jgi:adenylate cyclase
MAILEFIGDTMPEKRKQFTQECTIGRTPDNDICIKENDVSRRHAVIRLAGDYYVIEDLGSKNGVLLNDKQLDSFVSQPLYNGDIIGVSSAAMVFYSEGKNPPSGGKLLEEEVKGEVTQYSSTDAIEGFTVIMKREEAAAFPKHATIDATMSMLELDKEDDLRAAVERFRAMVKVSAELGTEIKSDILLQKIMDSIFDIFPQADRSFIMLRDSEDGAMKPAASSRRNAAAETEESFEVSRTIIDSVIENKQSVLSSNALQDDRFTGGRSIADFSIQSLMYVPFIHKDEILGIITVDTTSKEQAFNKDDLAMLTGIAAEAAIALKNVQLYKEVEKETQQRTQLSRYLSPDIVEGILEGTIPLRLGGEEKYGTVLFSDIVGFTSMSENMTALEVVERLNRYFLLVTEIITRNRGTLHKFEGDMVMAFWNVMFEDENAALNAVRTGLQMQLAVWLFGLELEAEGQKPIYLGVGCNTGSFAGGNIGGKDKMEYTVIGDNINTGKRIESLSGRWQVFIAESTYNPIKDKCIAIGLPPARVKGKEHPIKTYSIRGVKVSDDEMLLNIPVLIQGEEGECNRRGVLFGCTTDDTFMASVYSCIAFCEEEELVLKFDIPEADLAFMLKGRVVSAAEKSIKDNRICSEIVISHIKANDTIASEFFKAGFIVESTKTWEEMKRR